LDSGESHKKQAIAILAWGVKINIMVSSGSGQGMTQKGFIQKSLMTPDDFSRNGCRLEAVTVAIDG